MDKTNKVVKFLIDKEKFAAKFVNSISFRATFHVAADTSLKLKEVTLKQGKGNWYVEGALSQDILQTHAKKIIQFLSCYFRGEKLPHIALELDISPFVEKVLYGIQKIPFGETISYSQLASAISREHAYRAVASACGKNPVPLVIGCHRVIAKNDGLGGFSAGGIAVKKELLMLEKIIR